MSEVCTMKEKAREDSSWFSSRSDNNAFPGTPFKLRPRSHTEYSDLEILTPARGIEVHLQRAEDSLHLQPVGQLVVELKEHLPCELFCGHCVVLVEKRGIYD
ncbi:hypothetical protein E2C01_008972 [Portunus trituberculatus]|uniref:Uncharacterized protein n=1 Tax=Portunus trituberculatus TaxID=210409 RepID=A0A5B7D274_PORTR|nr:hypothetical protein [Portunus trituberculatus]